MRVSIAVDLSAKLAFIHEWFSMRNRSRKSEPQGGFGVVRGEDGCSSADKRKWWALMMLTDERTFGCCVRRMLYRKLSWRSDAG